MALSQQSERATQRPFHRKNIHFHKTSWRTKQARRCERHAAPVMIKCMVWHLYNCVRCFRVSDSQTPQQTFQQQMMCDTVRWWRFIIIWSHAALPTARIIEKAHLYRTGDAQKWEREDNTSILWNERRVQYISRTNPNLNLVWGYTNIFFIATPMESWLKCLQIFAGKLNLKIKFRT